MARQPRTPKAALIEPPPAEPDLVEGAVPPRSATTLVGHLGVRDNLASQFANAPPQALLVTGPRGIGKATLGFRLAKTLFSGAAVTSDFHSDPDDRQVAQVSAGSHPSLLHLTRAYDDKTKRFKSELSVDTVRRIVPFLGTSAAGNGWRVVIVDAVDDLNINAANALLKSLEEPPRRTLFFLVAHVAGRVLPTIRSRCQTVRLRPLSETEVADVLRHLGADESVADLAQGSVQRALTLSSSGPDAVRTAQRLLNGSLRDPRPRFQLADLASEKRGEHFQVVADLTLEAIATRARQSAAQAPLEALNALAQAYLSALAERRRVEVFNLDRKEYMLALCDRLAHAEGLMRR